MAKGFGDMMKQVQKMQARMMELQEELNAKEVEGSAGGGMPPSRRWSMLRQCPGCASTATSWRERSATSGPTCR